MTEETTPSPGDERATLATLLSANAELVVGVLRPAEGAPQVPVLAALTATRNLGHLVDDILHTLARQAKREGHTWAELGDLLGTSRQAAYQRFSGPMPPAGPFPPPPPFPLVPPTPPGMPVPPHRPHAPGSPDAPDATGEHHPPGPSGFPPPGGHAGHHRPGHDACATRQNPPSPQHIPGAPPVPPPPNIPTRPGAPTPPTGFHIPPHAPAPAQVPTTPPAPPAPNPPIPPSAPTPPDAPTPRS
ncbi:hypothetical protein [Nocardia arizonensis]|uniref:hypothetical protein n=1 Tax=Nocardia arizonensis TaxID=1141647 RepID=UPI000AEF0879|nr:hypothetical protein [Nocardia arizonensis]